MKSRLFVVFLFVSSAVRGQTYGDYNLVVQVTGNGFAHTTAIYFDDESWDPLAQPTYGWDPCCDANLFLGNANQPHISTRVVAPPSPPVNQRLSINGLPHLFETTDVTMGFLPGELAPYNFFFKELYTLPAGVTVELEDVAQNVTQDLLVDSTYSTWGAVSDDEERFILHFYPSSVTHIDNEKNAAAVEVRLENGHITIFGLEDDNVIRIRCFNLMGQKLMDQPHPFETSIKLPPANTGLQVYIVEITTKKGKVIRKKLLWKL